MTCVQSESTYTQNLKTNCPIFTSYQKIKARYVIMCTSLPPTNHARTRTPGECRGSTARRLKPPISIAEDVQIFKQPVRRNKRLLSRWRHRSITRNCRWSGSIAPSSRERVKRLQWSDSSRRRVRCRGLSSRSPKCANIRCGDSVLVIGITSAGCPRWWRVGRWILRLHLGRKWTVRL